MGTRHCDAGEGKADLRPKKGESVTWPTGKPKVSALHRGGRGAHNRLKDLNEPREALGKGGVDTRLFFRRKPKNQKDS